MHSVIRFAPRVISFATLLIVGVLLPAPTYGQEEETPATPDAPAEGTLDAPADAPPEITEEQYKEAEKQAAEAMANEEFEKAYDAYTLIAVYGQQKSLGELSLNAILGRSKALIGLRDFAAAELELGNILESNPNLVPVLIARGELFLEMGDPERAYSDFESAVTLVRSNPGFIALRPQVQFGLGKSLARLRQWQAAIRPLTVAIEANPDNAEAYHFRGMAYNGLVKFDKAVEDLQKAISLDPEDHESYFWLAVTHLQQDDYQAATEQFGHAIEHYKPLPDQEDAPYSQAYLTRSSAFIELGKRQQDEAARKASYAAAVEEAEKLLALLNEKDQNTAGTRSAALYSRAVGERMLGDLYKAVQTFTEAIEINPQLSEAYFRRGICYHMLGEDTMALADFVATANLAYDDPRANLWEGFTYARQGNYLEAVRAYSDAIAASDRYAPAYFNRALTYMALGDNERAIADFSDAIRFEPTKSDYYVQRGLAYARLGNQQKASESFAGAIQTNPSNAVAHRHMADALQRLNRTDEANQHRQKANELAPPKK